VRCSSPGSTEELSIELLLGRPAGRRRADGSWEPGSINALVEHRLAEMAKSLARHKIEDIAP
jgi:hypothetical protein